MGVEKGSGRGFKVGRLILPGNVLHLSGSGAPTDGTSGTGAGKAAKGSTYFDYTNALAWLNTGTQASPVWVALGVHLASISITNAEIKALRATPKTLVAAPGSGKVAELVGGMLILKAGANVLTESTANLAVKYTDGSGTQISETIESTGFIDQATDTMTSIRVKQDGIVASSACANKALVLHNLGGGEFAGNAAADATLRVKLAYRIWATA